MSMGTPTDGPNRAFRTDDEGRLDYSGDYFDDAVTEFKTEVERVVGPELWAELQPFEVILDVPEEEVGDWYADYEKAVAAGDIPPWDTGAKLDGPSGANWPDDWDADEAA
jgi:hypothetical protein